MALASVSAIGEQESAAAIGSTYGSGAVDLDRLISEASDRLARLDPKPPIGFNFSGRDIAFVATVDATDLGFRLVLDGDLGAVPYSAESEAGRVTLLALVAGPQSAVPGRFRLKGLHRLHFIAGADVEGRATGSTILGWTVQLLVRAAPWLEEMGGLCVARPAPRR